MWRRRFSASVRARPMALASGFIGNHCQVVRDVLCEGVGYCPPISPFMRPGSRFRKAAARASVCFIYQAYHIVFLYARYRVGDTPPDFKHLAVFGVMPAPFAAAAHGARHCVNSVHDGVGFWVLRPNVGQHQGRGKCLREKISPRFGGTGR